MRVIEKAVIDILKNYENAREKKLSIRDRISICYRTLKNTIGKAVQYRLWNSIVAEYDGNQVSLGVLHGQWKTRTTKSRINAIAYAFNLPCIVSKRDVWYWSDNKEYLGTRIFSIGIPSILKNGQYEFPLDNSI